MTDIRDGDDGSYCSSSASTVKRSNITIPPDSPINWKVLGLLFGWLSTPQMYYQLTKLKRLWKTSDFFLELDLSVRSAILIGPTSPNGLDYAACVRALEKLFQEHEEDYFVEYEKHRTADVNDDRKPPASCVKHRTTDDDDEGNPRVKRSRGNEERVAAAPGVRNVAAAAAASVNEGTAMPASDSAASGSSAPGVVEVVVKPGDAANSPSDDASSPSVSVMTASTHSRTLPSAAVLIELGGATGSPSDDSSNLHGRAMGVDVEQIVEHGGVAGPPSKDSSNVRGSGMSIDAQDQSLP